VLSLSFRICSAKARLHLGSYCPGGRGNAQNPSALGTQWIHEIICTVRRPGHCHPHHEASLWLLLCTIIVYWMLYCTVNGQAKRDPIRQLIRPTHHEALLVIQARSWATGGLAAVGPE
jgi:hypothetical protein